MAKTIKDFELSETEVALALDKDWTINIYIPQMGDDEIVPDYILILTKIGVLLRDESFVKYVLDFDWPNGANPGEAAPNE